MEFKILGFEPMVPGTIFFKQLISSVFWCSWVRIAVWLLHFLASIFGPNRNSNRVNQLINRVDGYQISWIQSFQAQ